jgi:hypothetical protein
MSKRKEKIQKFNNNPKWIIVGVLLIIVILSVILTPAAKTLSIKSFFMQKTPVEPKTKQIPVTVYPLNEISKDDYLKMAIDNLSNMEHLDKTKIIVKSAEVIDWGDTSLGCPKEGMIYAQIITPGYKIMLSAEGKDFDYHAGLKRAVFCSVN